MTGDRAAQVLSLPAAGGAIRGLGEKFTPDVQTGTGNFSVPLDLPAGRGALVPNLGLQYSTGAGNGPYGLGWTLSVPGVTRQTMRGVPRYDDADVFVLSGAEDLVPVPGAAVGRQRYRPRTEGLFARIERAGDTWEVRGRDGLISRYGTPDVGPGDPAVVADPTTPARVFAWRLTSTVDAFGNRVEYRYERDTAAGGPRSFTQTYLAEICYADHGDPANPEFLVHVRFRYEDRPDPFSDHRAGFEVRTRQRCSRIEVFVGAGIEQLSRSYELVYADDPRSGVTADRLPANGVSLLAQVVVTGHDGDRTESLPPLRFGYRPFEPGRRDLVAVDTPVPRGSVADRRQELVDVTGDGLPDVLEMNGVVRYWRNRGDGTFDRPREMSRAPSVGLGERGVQLLDADGDGRLDLMVTTDGLAGFFPLSSSGEFDRRSFRRYEVAPSVELSDAQVRLVDLTGDGITDALRTGTGLECFFNDPRRGWQATRRVARRDRAVFPDVDFADPRVRVADLSGDGLADIAIVTDRHVWYWPSLGHGDFGPRVVMGNAPALPANHDPGRILVGDVDGDGLADIVYVDDRHVTVWINQGGNRFAEPIEIGGTPRVTDPAAVSLTDLLGVGTSGVLWGFDTGAADRPRAFFLDLTGGAKSYLLTEMDNGLGARTVVDYASSTRFAVADAARSGTRWRTTLPFPVQVVARVRSIDAISGGTLTTEYAYHHGYWDGREREFRGFGRVDQRDGEVIDGATVSAPTETRTWFHLGAVDGEDGSVELDLSAEYYDGDPAALARPAAVAGLLASLPAADRRDALRALRGTVLRRELYALDGSDRADRPYTVVETLTGLREESPPGAAEDGRRRVFFPHGLAERTTVWERGDDPMTTIQFTGDHDRFGQAGHHVSIAVPRGRDYRRATSSAEPYLATVARTSFAQRDDDRLYLTDRVARTTTFEVVNTGSPSALTLYESVTADVATLKVIADTRSFYDGAPFTGLALGALGDHGVLVRRESLALTAEILDAANVGIPPYLASAGAPAWTPDYPEEFRTGLPPLAGYVAGEGGWYAVDAANHYDCQDGPGRGLLRATRDPLGNQITIDYDAFDLLPVRTTDPAGMTTEAGHDYRILQPASIREPNGTRTVVTFGPLGMVESTAVIDKDGTGDTPDVPSISLEYDLHAFVERGAPVAARTTRRVHHVGEPDVAADERDEAIVTVEYSDGFGRLVQTRTQADRLAFGDDLLGQVAATGVVSGTARPERVAVSGWQVYDNKGRVVEKFEPFFADGFDYARPTAAELAQRSRLFYDPRGQLVRTVNPDGSQQRVVLGVPTDLAAPDEYVPTPWERYTYDANDEAGRTHPATAAETADHWNTPTSTQVDALGRTVRTVVRNGPAPADAFATSAAYDIRGNQLSTTDSLGRIAFEYVYDLANRPLRAHNIDAGDRVSVFDAAGNRIEHRDGRGALVLHVVDALHRPTRLFARDRDGESVTLRERIDYGDVLGADGAVANGLGRVARRYDEAGLLTIHRYDFKGNPIDVSRQTIADKAILAVFDAVGPDGQVAAFRVDWQPPAGRSFADHELALLDPATHRITASYDALNRRQRVRYPAAVDGGRRELRARYAASGALAGVDVDGTVFLDQVAYNARGQRTLTVYGNGVMTRHVYDPATFRLTRLRTERFTAPAAATYSPTGSALQDLTYAHDPAGNLLTLTDETPGCGIPGTPAGLDRLVRSFQYDPMYRLVSATGRECAADAPSQFDPGPRCTDVTRTRSYTETYGYDSEGSLVALHHAAGSATFARSFATAGGGNRVVTMTAGAISFAYGHDAAGNQVSEGVSRHYEWDHAQRLRVFRDQVGAAAPTVHAHYLYDATGQRVKKLVRKLGRVETTVYVDGIFEHHRVTTASGTTENSTLHVMDGASRVAEIRVGTPFPDDATPAVKFHLGDHLGSSAVIVDGTGVLVNREELTPYGETSFGSYARKRYRFTGKERDEESGLSYHTARYYAPWLARWASPDPAGPVDGTNLYRYAGNPLRFVDPGGRDLVTHDTEIAISAKGIALRPSKDTAAIGKALARLEKKGKIAKSTDGNQTRFSSTGATQGEVERALAKAGFVAAADMATALVDPHDVSEYTAAIKFKGVKVGAGSLERKTTRSLTHFERQEAQKVFGAALKLDGITVVEEDPAAASGMAHGYPSKVTFAKDIPADQFMDKMIHELAHVWQYAYYGEKAVNDDVAKHAADAKKYDYGWVKGLEDRTKAGKGLDDFWMEQQAAMIDHYYQRMAYRSWGGDTTAYEPFIKELQSR